MCRVVYTSSAVKELKKADGKRRKGILAKINALAADPFNPALDVKAMQGVPLYRLRVRDWRVIFARDDTARVIDIRRIAPRKDAYE